MAPRVADRVPGGGGRGAGRLPRVHDRRRVDRRRADRRPATLARVPQRVPAPRHAGSPTAAARSPTATIRCPYHAGATRSTAGSSTSPTARSSPACPTTSRCAPVRVECWGGFVFVNLDPDAEPLLDFLDPLPALLAPYHFDEMRFRGVPHARSSTRTGRPSSTRSTRATTCRACTRRSCRGPTT